MEELDKKWDIHKIISEAVQSSHLQSAPETRERLLALELSQKNFMDKLEEFQKDNKEGHQSILDALNKFEERMDKTLETKAGVWVEKVIVWCGITVSLGLVGYFGSLIVKLIEM